MRAHTLPENPPSGQGMLVARELEALFSATFSADYRTVLAGGAEEPLYLPGDPAQIRYTRDYFRSALHEVAHWCVAGPARRGQQDYGYWYRPDGRNTAQQAEFERVERRPQALELLFCAACEHRFSVSLDNLDGAGGAGSRFADAVRDEALMLLERGPGGRAGRWIDALAGYYRGGAPLRGEDVLAIAGNSPRTSQKARL